MLYRQQVYGLLALLNIYLYSIINIEFWLLYLTYVFISRSSPIVVSTDETFIMVTECLCWMQCVVVRACVCVVHKVCRVPASCSSLTPHRMRWRAPASPEYSHPIGRCYLHNKPTIKFLLYKRNYLYSFTQTLVIYRHTVVLNIDYVLI